MTAQQISEIVLSNDTVYSTANEYARYYAPPSKESGFHFPIEANGEIHVDPENQICIVPAGLTVSALQEQLAEQNLCLPFPICPSPANGEDRLSLRQAIDLNLPHAAEAQCGNWRDWIIGMTLVLGDGTIAKSGSQAVKSVAGYDAHKLVIGARGTLGIIADVILRIRPVASRITPHLILSNQSRATSIQRVLASDFKAALEQDFTMADPASSTIWRSTREDIKRFPHDWVMREDRMDLDRSPLRGHYLRAKQLLDPENKLNPGLLGIF